MKTPMQELIDEMTHMLTEGEQSIYALREQARKLLDKEKEVMCQFQSDGQRTDFWVKYEDNEDCFDETFKTKER